MSRRTERGSGTVLSLFWLSIFGCGVVVALVVALLIAQAHQISSAADLAALSAAVHAADGQPAACAAASRVAGSMTATVQSCRLDGLVVTVELQSRGITLWGVHLPMRAAARAGPASSS
jgi:secretion/DNA translocation related TadE-like protein